MFNRQTSQAFVEKSCQSQATLHKAQIVEPFELSSDEEI